MATTIITKNGNGVPADGTLAVGELAVDLDTGIIYTSSDGNDVITATEDVLIGPGTTLNTLATWDGTEWTENLKVKADPTGAVELGEEGVNTGTLKIMSDDSGSLRLLTFFGAGVMDAPPSGSMIFQTDGTNRVELTPSGQTRIGPLTNQIGEAVTISGTAGVAAQESTPLVLVRDGGGASDTVGVTFTLTGGSGIAGSRTLRLVNGDEGLQIQALEDDGTFVGVVFRALHTNSSSPNAGRVQFGQLGNGTVFSNNGFLTNTNPSDEALKENIIPIAKSGVEAINSISPVSFTWKDEQDDGFSHYGFIAQDIEENLPELYRDESGQCGYVADELVQLLVKAVQDQVQDHIDLLLHQPQYYIHLLPGEVFLKHLVWEGD